MTASQAFAQELKGDMGINVHAGISTTRGAQGLTGVEFRVAIADGWRLAPQFNIGGGNDLKFFDITVDAHYVINTTLKISRSTPLAGLGYVTIGRNTVLIHQRLIASSSTLVLVGNMPSANLSPSQPK